MTKRKLIYDPNCPLLIKPECPVKKSKECEACDVKPKCGYIYYEVKNG